MSYLFKRIERNDGWMDGWMDTCQTDGMNVKCGTCIRDYSVVKTMSTKIILFGFCICNFEIRILPHQITAILYNQVSLCGMSTKGHKKRYELQYM